jgi:hypothetical protein
MKTSPSTAVGAGLAVISRARNYRACRMASMGGDKKMTVIPDSVRGRRGLCRCRDQ